MKRKRLRHPLTTWRRRNGWSQAHLASYLDVSRVCVTRIELWDLPVTARLSLELARLTELDEKIFLIPEMYEHGLNGRFPNVLIARDPRAIELDQSRSIRLHDERMKERGYASLAPTGESDNGADGEPEKVVQS